MASCVNSTSQTAEVAALYVKNVPEKLMRLVRSTAALEGEPMREFVLRAVVTELERLGVEVPEDAKPADDEDR
jgi:hypothetical protein